MGSSPRVWGQGGIQAFALTVLGIIPTRVGTRRPERAYTTTRKDHPHACGDKNNINVNARNGTGSSPRVWGQEYPLAIPPSVEGIIPTRVGTSPRADNLKRSREDHPHACGDKKAEYEMRYRG